MPARVSADQLRERRVYTRRAKLSGEFHRYSFAATKLAKSGKLTPAQKSAITRRYKEQRGIRRQVKEDRLTFVRVKSAYRRRAASQSGEVAVKTNRGVFVSIRRGSLEKTAKVKVTVGRGGSVVVKVGRRKIETVRADALRLARDPVKALRAELKRRRGSSVTIVVNGYESLGSYSKGYVNTQDFEQYINDLLRNIQTDVEKRNRRLRRKGKGPVDYTARDVVAFRIYSGSDAPRTVRGVEAQDGVDFEDIEDDENEE